MLRAAPRVVGMMQYAHGSSQPVCTRSVNAVRPATPGSIGAARAVAVAEPERGRQQIARIKSSTSVSLSSFAHDARRRPAAQQHRLAQRRRVAAGHDDSRGGIVARDAADRLARALIGGRRDRTGVHDDDDRHRPGRPRRHREHAASPRGAASRPGSRGSRR